VVIPDPRQSKREHHITPLRKRKDGEAYTRLPFIESKLVELSALTRDQVLERCKATQWDDPLYLPTECVLHLVRACRDDDRSVHFETLYNLLIKRVHRVLKARGVRDTAALTDIRIRETALDKFVDMLMRDRSVYEEQLDFYEVRFNDATAALIVDAQRKVIKEVTKAATFEVDPETGTLSGEVERTGDFFELFNPAKLRSEDYRSSLDAAIDTLTPDQRKIIEMLRLGFPIDSQEPGVTTIANTLKKSEKTIRTYRDEALAHLRAWMTKGESR
jgi:hypothetical protein